MIVLNIYTTYKRNLVSLCREICLFGKNFFPYHLIYTRLLIAVMYKVKFSSYLHLCTSNSYTRTYLIIWMVGNLYLLWQKRLIYCFISLHTRFLNFEDENIFIHKAFKLEKILKHWEFIINWFLKYFLLFVFTPFINWKCNLRDKTSNSFHEREN